MNAPGFWQQLLIAVIGIASIPYMIALLAKLRLLPLAICLLAVNIFTTWAAEHKTACVILLAVCVLYPVLTVVVKVVRWWQEERQARNYLLATARPFTYDRES